MKRRCFELEFLDVAHKWADDTQTTVQLVYYDELGLKSVLAYVHDDLGKEAAKTMSNYYLDLMFDVIRKDIFK